MHGLAPEVLFMFVMILGKTARMVQMLGEAKTNPVQRVRHIMNAGKN